MTVPAPSTVRQAAVIVGCEGALALAAAVFYVVSGLMGDAEPGLNKFGTAAWFAIMGAGVVAAGRALWQGRRWGRGIAVFANLLLLPVSWYMGPGSGQWLYAVVVAVVALAALVLLFSPSALEWLGQDSASADNAGPDTR
ncbi:hypothetical protein [uncultured Mycolicibacterium sp.]|uniref:hypothetical protein n=1 Tax=uncultured Mycolicibacterium sp. TaxID=2320817 RepID=UPI00261CB237|nr:hypothetical protein [uncultured Mycolicibacterium sp.]